MRLFFVMAVGCVAWTAAAGTLRFEGVLGNSGEPGHPVTFGPRAQETRGLGVAYDGVRGVLYERAGSGRLNGYALDGRCVAQFVLPDTRDNRDAMTLCGDRLVLLLGGALYVLPLAAPSGSAPAKLACGIDAPETLSSSARDGRVAVRNKAGRLFLLNPADGKTEPFGDAPGDVCEGMDWDELGRFFILFGKTAQTLENGRLVENAQWPKRYAGERESGIERATRIGAYWYGGAWHGTVKRFGADFEPEPGVILGGASGHFIGHVPCNYDADLPRGIRQIAPGVFVVGGLYGVVQLAEWRPERKGLVLVRRIGALPEPGGIAVDVQGRVLVGRNVWNWGDDALAPAGVGHPFRMIAPCAFLGDDTLVGLADCYGKVSIAMGRLGDDEMACNRMDKLALPGDVVGMAAYHDRPGGKGGWRLLALGASGRAHAHEIVADRRNPWRGDSGEVRLETALPVKVYTAAALAGPETLLAAAEGQVIAFARDGADWKETGRWSDGFGRNVRIAVSGERLAVADTENNRVAVYGAADHRKLAETRVNAPTEIALCGGFLVAYDAVGQRLMKFVLTDE